jgi:iron complex outermembrane receptor protein
VRARRQTSETAADRKYPLKKQNDHQEHEGKAMRNGYSSGAALAVLAWSLGIPAAWAAPAENGTGADAGAEDASPEIVVTAQKRNQNVNDVPIAINAFGGAALADAGVKSLESLSSIAPSLTVTSTAATGVPVYTIRGVGFSDYSTSASSTVGIYADDIALPYAVMTRGAFFDVGQVEVLKGPQGDLYGRNSTAGQININSARPTDTFKAGASADVSNWGKPIWKPMSAGL